VQNKSIIVTLSAEDKWKKKLQCIYSILLPGNLT